MSDAFDPAAGLSYDAEAGAYRAGFDAAAVEPSVAVVETVAFLRDVESTRLPPLFETVDPCALNELCGGDRRDDDCAVTFTYLGQRIRVESGVVEVRTRPGAPD